MRLHPFRAVRPASDLAERVAAVPYDVVSRAEAVALAEGNPYSFLHVGRSDIDLPADVNPYDARIYAKARETLDRFQAEGTLHPRGHARRSTSTARSWTGGRRPGSSAACTSTTTSSDVIRKHEKTRQDKEDDRTRHVLTLRANAEPVFLTYRGPAGDRGAHAAAPRRGAALRLHGAGRRPPHGLADRRGGTVPGRLPERAARLRGRRTPSLRERLARGP